MPNPQDLDVQFPFLREILEWTNYKHTLGLNAENLDVLKELIVQILHDDRAYYRK